MGVRKICVGTLVSLSLLGCSHPQHIYVLNNSGAELRLHTDRTIYGEEWDEKIVVVPSGRGRTFHPANLVLYPDRLVHVIIGGCEVFYRLPDADWRHNYQYMTLGLRLDPDLTVHQMLPRRPESLGHEFSVHPGFPLKPASRVCP